MAGRPPFPEGHDKGSLTAVRLHWDSLEPLVVVTLLRSLERGLQGFAFGNSYSIKLGKKFSKIIVLCPQK